LFFWIPFLAFSGTRVADTTHATATHLPTDLIELAEPGWLPRAGTMGDSDGDGFDDLVDIDDDNDTIPDATEGTVDTDGDGVADCLDLDSDNDGITDFIEAIADPGLLRELDVDADHRLDSSLALGNNGLVDRVETAPDSGESITGFNDTDGDGLVDQNDLDSDNDGIPDVVEAVGGGDVDFNGSLDRFRDIDGDGLDDQLALLPIDIRDTDGDGTLDFRDTDSDQDGLSDRRETHGTDADGDGRVDQFADNNSDGLADTYLTDQMLPRDTDGDRLPDYLDTDSDNDGLPDEQEGGASATTSNTDSLAANTNADINTNPMADSSESPNASADVGSSNLGDGFVDNTIVTGREGSVIGGCSTAGVPLSSHRWNYGGLDPTLLILIIIAGVYMLSRRYPVKWLPALLLCSGCSTLSSTSDNHALPSSAPSIYAGVGIGVSRLDVDTAGTNLEVDEHTSPAGQFTLGVDLRPRLSLEARLADLGEVRFTNEQSLGYQVADVSGLYHLRLQRWDVFGRVGIGALFNDGDVDANQRNPSHLVIGGGVGYAFGPRWRLRAELMGHDVDASHAQLSVVYHFGATTHAGPIVQQTAPTPTTAEATSPGTDAADAAVPDATVTPAPLPDITSKDLEESEEADNEATVRPSEPMPRPTIAPRIPTRDSATYGPQAELAVLTDFNTDRDADNVPDVLDDCPDTPEGAIVSDEGCALFGGPAPGIAFEPGTDQFIAGAEIALDRVLQALEDDAELSLIVAAHTAPSFDPAANLLLSRRRSLSVIRYLTARGIDASRLRPQAFGDSRPLAGARDVANNDRIELIPR